MLRCLLIACGILLLFSAGVLLPDIHEQRIEYELIENRTLENAPPELVLATTALGGFRGLIIDYLWFRAFELREQGAHYEIVQLYDWIGKLEPRIPEIWDYTAWEMAYNISVTLPPGEDRWRWILKGIEQLRDFGIQYNPNTPKLYQDLGQSIFINKMEVDSIDLSSAYYQRRWADMFEQILGEKGNLQELARAPKYDDLLKNPQIQALTTAFSNISIDLWQDFFQLSTLEEKKQQQLQRLLQQGNNRDLFAQVSACLRAKKLRETYKMDIDKMIALNEAYGDIDWRIASAHALYWGVEGLAVLEKVPEYKGGSLEGNLQRLKRSALRKLFQYGRIIGKDAQGLVRMPNFTILDAALQSYDEMFDAENDLQTGSVSYEDFLRHAVWLCYMYKGKKKALEYYRLLTQKFTSPQYRLDLDLFVVKNIGHYVKNIGQRYTVESFIGGTLLQAFYALLNNIPEQYVALERFAHVKYRFYVKRHGALEKLTDEDKPRPWLYFQKVAIKVFQEQLQKKLGKLQSEKLFARLRQNFPKVFKIDAK